MLFKSKTCWVSVKLNNPTAIFYRSTLQSLNPEFSAPRNLYFEQKRKISVEMQKGFP